MALGSRGKNLSGIGQYGNGQDRHGGRIRRRLISFPYAHRKQRERENRKL